MSRHGSRVLSRQSDREEYDVKANQLTGQIAHLEKQITDLQASLKTDVLTADQEQAAMELLQTIVIAGERATFQDKRAFLRLVDAQILYDRDLIQMTGGVPTQKISRQELHALKNGDQNSSRLPQSARSSDFLPVGMGSSIRAHRRTRGCTPD